MNSGPGRSRDWTSLSHRSILTLLGVGLLCGCGGPISSEEPGFVSIFDGESLEGWRAAGGGTSRDWSVQDGRLVGICQGRSSYLLWKDQELRDFELKLSYRLLTEANTGIDIRSRVDVTGKRPFESYHADLGHVGIGKNILGSWDFHFGSRPEPDNPRGTRLVIGADETPQLTAIEDPLTLDDVNRRPEWNRVHIIARGNHCRFLINGKLSSEFTDNAESGRLEKGGIALQLHDPGVHVEFKDMRLKRL